MLSAFSKLWESRSCVAPGADSAHENVMDGKQEPGPSTKRSSSKRLTASSRKYSTDELEARPVCKYGSSCYQRSPDHLESEAHPADEDYLLSCRHFDVKPEFVSIRKLFDWCDPNCTGKATRQALSTIWTRIIDLGTNIGPLNDKTWSELDDDGNGHVNFSEFAEFTTMHQVKLPLGLDDLLGMGKELDHRCGVHTCSCNAFKERKLGRRQCKWAEECYRRNPDHLANFCHPADSDWAAPGSSTSRHDPDMCICGHKRKLHASALTGAASIEYPRSWCTVCAVKEFNSLVVPKGTAKGTTWVQRFQKLLDETYSDVTSRDRHKHSGTWQVPRGFIVQTVLRNENSKMWRKYMIKKAEMLRDIKVDPATLRAFEEKHGLDKYRTINDVHSTKVWEDMMDAGDERLDANVNEWYLFHGTSAAAAKNICSTDFKMRLAGSMTGSLYGRGSYLAESITKADEYAKDDKGTFTVLLCRVLGGRVRYCDERTPDPELMTKSCIEDDYDCILGDRKKVSGTYREFIFFDAEHLYPEYVVTYKRKELFKSPSHP